MRKPNYYNQVITLLHDLKKKYPTFNVGRHLSTALVDYGDLWGVPDKEVLFALTKYKTELELDSPRETDEEELQRIIDDGMDLSNILEDKDEDY